nr:NlpC/P60 family protein [Nonomuraea sp. FMUSA5-5]
MPERGAGLPQRDAGRTGRRAGLPGRDAGTSERGAGLSGDAFEPGCGEIGAASLAVSAALAQRGIPYSYGGGGPAGPGYGIGRGARTKGFDCSGLTEYAWSKAGIRIGGTTYEQVGRGRKIPRSQVRAGDLVFYETDASRPGPDHVGLAVSGTKMVNAPRTGTVVRLDAIDRPSYVTAVRPSAMGPGRR